MIAYASGHTVAAKSAVSRLENALLFPLLSFMFALALLYFLYGAYEFVAGADNENARNTGKQHMVWGIVGMIIMTSSYVILRIAAGTFGLTVPQ